MDNGPHGLNEIIAKGYLKPRSGNFAANAATVASRGVTEGNPRAMSLFTPEPRAAATETKRVSPLHAASCMRNASFRGFPSVTPRLTTVAASRQNYHFVVKNGFILKTFATVSFRPLSLRLCL